MQQFKRQLQCTIAELESVHHGQEFPAYLVDGVERVPIFDESEFLDYFSNIVRESYVQAAAFGFVQEPPAALIGRDDALYHLKLVAAWCDGQSDIGETVGLCEAADILGMSESGLRKLVRRGEIRYSQTRKGAAIRFRREWLDEFIEPPAPVRPRLPKAAKGAFGFRDSLLR